MKNTIQLNDPAADLDFLNSGLKKKLHGTMFIIILNSYLTKVIVPLKLVSLPSINVVDTT